VKGVAIPQLEHTGAEMVLANTYHLHLLPGEAVVAEAGGLHRFMGWQGPLLTDSGGYQVFSLGAINRIDDDGVVFRSRRDGARIALTPERAMAIQMALGADVAMAFDQCPPWPAMEGEVAEACRRTHAWLERCISAHDRPDQALFGIVQGGISETMRAESAQRTAALGFDGYGIGGLSVGETRAEMVPALAAAIAHLPADRPRYLMGVGDPASLVEAVGLGVDQFDCVLQTRLGRHGTALTDAGKLHVKNAVHALSDDPIDAACACEVCARHTRGYIRHLFQVGEPTASRLVSIHNVSWTLQLMARMRRSIAAGTFDSMRREVLEVWG
jgi:queuine tRNA-ribosyltransferase